MEQRRNKEDGTWVFLVGLGAARGVTTGAQRLEHDAVQCVCGRQIQVHIKPPQVTQLILCWDAPQLFMNDGHDVQWDRWYRTLTGA